MAWSDDGAAALLATRDADAYMLELVSSQRERPQRFTVAKRDCVAQLKRLAASLNKLGFTGVEVRAKACNGRPDTLIRTLKRHSEQAHESFVKDFAPNVPELPKGELRWAVGAKLVLAFVAEKDGAALAAAYAREGDTYRALDRL